MGKKSEKLLDGLIKLLGIGRLIDASKEMTDQDAWRVMIVKVTQRLNFDVVSQDLFHFLWARGFFC